MNIQLTHGTIRGEVTTRGGELISLRDAQGTEYLWNGDPAFWSGRNPNLFPIVGNLKDGKIAFGERVCEMSRHGFARNSEFALAEQGEDFAVLELREREETLARYPFPFALRVRHQLLENGFSTAFIVTNTGTAPMPFCVGGHTAFRCPLNEGEWFEDYEIVFDQAEDADTLLLSPAGLLTGQTEPFLRGEDRFALDRSVFERLDTIIFQGLNSTGVRLRHKGTGKGVRLDFSQFPMVAFWSKSGAESPFVCLEPWQGCAAREDESGQFADKPHVITLQPGETKELKYSVTIL